MVARPLVRFLSFCTEATLGLMGLRGKAQRSVTEEEIAASLSVARSNVSTSLRELQAWGIVRVVHVLGDQTTVEKIAEYHEQDIDPDLLRNLREGGVEIK